MISLELFGPILKDKEKLLWQTKSQWLGKPPLSGPIEISIGLGFEVPKSYGYQKKTQALNQLLLPDNNLSLSSVIDFYFDLMENVIVKNKSQIYKTSIQKYYCEKPKTTLFLTPKTTESFITGFSGVL